MNINTLKRKTNTALTWAKVFDSPRSFLNVIRLNQRGRTGGSYSPESALPLYLHGLDVPLYCRPGTSDYVTFKEIFISHGGEYADFVDVVSDQVNYILDLGTNVGYSIGFFLREWPGATVVGVEPFLPNVRMAQKSFGPLVEDGQVRIDHSFVGSHSDYASIVAGGAGGANEFRMSDSDTLDTKSKLGQVAVKSVSEIIATEFPPVDIDILKCDIEGGETKVFTSCASWIKRVRYLVVELHDGLDEAWLQRRLSENGGMFNVCGSRRGYGEAKLVWLKSEDQK